jgi:hypothetical protein
VGNGVSVTSIFVGVADGGSNVAVAGTVVADEVGSGTRFDVALALTVDVIDGTGEGVIDPNDD